MNTTRRIERLEERADAARQTRRAAISAQLERQYAAMSDAELEALAAQSPELKELTDEELWAILEAAPPGELAS